jgi:threonine dehydrogenase-like Zn-dependent dehydrogenase
VRGVTFEGHGEMRVSEVPEPTIEAPTDALVQVTMAGICGTDLHILNRGDDLDVPRGTRVGHEILGEVVAVGPEVRGAAVGDRVLVSCTPADGTCRFCREELDWACERWSCFGWGPQNWRQGGIPQGGQSDLVRVPLADGTLVRIPEALAGADREAGLLPLIDVMSTGWHGLVTGGVRAGRPVVVIGDGAVGLCAVHGAAAMSAEPIVCLGHHDDRLALATALGATHTSSSRNLEELGALVRDLTGGDGSPVVVDTITGTLSLQAAHAVVRTGGTISCVGMDHFVGRPAGLDWGDQFWRNLTVTGGLLPGRRYIPHLVDLAEAGRVDVSAVMSHRLPLTEAPEGYRLMNERAPGVVKVAVAPGA